MTDSTFVRLRQEVCADAGIPASAAATFVGETHDTIAGEALAWVEARRGREGVREALAGFRARNERETPDDLRARISRDLGLPVGLRDQLSTATKTEAEVADDALSLLRQHGGSAALDEGVRRLQQARVDSHVRDQLARRRNPPLEVADDGKPDMDAALRAMSGRGSRPVSFGDE